MHSFALLPLLLASALAVDLLHEPIPQYNQEQNTATGEYGYSYHGGPSAKTEYRASDGTTTGTYSYVDANGILQTTSYIADEFGFRAAGSNIPVDGVTPLDAPDVALVKANHLAEHSRATLAALHSQRRKRSAILPTFALAPAVASVHHLPYATSSQSRFQIHNGAKIIEQVHQPIYAAAATPVIASHSLLFRKKRGILAAAVPLPSSSAKIYDELPKPAVLAAAPIAAPLAAATTTITQHLPYATSSQSRFQIHNGAKIIEQVHQPIYAPIAPAFPAAPFVPAFPAAPIAPAFPAAPFAPAYPAAPIEEAVYAEDSIAVDSA